MAKSKPLQEYKERDAVLETYARKNDIKRYTLPLSLTEISRTDAEQLLNQLKNNKKIELVNSDGEPIILLVLIKYLWIRFFKIINAIEMV